MIEKQELVEEETQIEQEVEGATTDIEEAVEQEPVREETQMEQDVEEAVLDAEEESAREETQIEQEVEEATTEIEEAVEQEPAHEEIQMEQDVEEAVLDAEKESTREETQIEQVEEALSEVGEEAVAEVEEESEEQEGRFWYVVHSYSGYENKVERNLESRIESMGMQDYIFQVVVPTEDVVELRDGRRRTVERRIFPGYILVDMIMTDESWFVVRNTPGVTGFVGSGSQPTPLRKEEADSILKRMEDEAPKVEVSFRVGETVRIVDGPFTDFLGTVDHLNLDRGKVRLMVSFFGRETPVELDFLQVERE